VRVSADVRLFYPDLVNQAIQRTLSCFLFLLSASSNVCLIAFGGAFRSVEPFALLSAAWVIVLSFVAYRSIDRIRSPLFAASLRSPLIIFALHSVLVAAWLTFALHQQSKEPLGGWAASLILHHVFEAPTTAACSLAEAAFQAVFQRGFPSVWAYAVYFSVGGVFYASIPLLFPSRTQIRRS